MRLAVYHPWIKEKAGAEKVVLEYARRSEHDVTVFTLFYDEDQTFDGFRDADIKVLGKNKKPEGFLRKGVKFGLGAALTDIDLDNFDALIVSEAGIGSLVALRNHDIPVICYCHTPLRAALPEFREVYSSDLNIATKPIFRISISFYSYLEKKAWSYFEKVLANSKLSRDRILSKELFEEELISVVNPGADVENNEPGDYGDYFFYPSRFRKYKRQDLAIEAFQEADLEGFKLILAGSGQDQEYIDELKDVAGDNIEIRTDVPGEEWDELYRNSYSVLFMAEKEDWGIIPIEAASFGKPVISVNEGGPQESVVDGETGFLVESTPSDIAEKMLYLAENRHRVEEIGNKARKESLKYSWEKFSQRIDKEVENTCQNSQS